MSDQNVTKESAGIRNTKALISSLWIFLSLNYIFCDVLSNMDSSTLNDLLTGETGGIVLTQGFLLAAGISLEIPFAMIVLSRVLKYKVNRIVNIVAGILMSLYQLSSFFVGTPPTLHYNFFSAVEILGNLIIVFICLKWKKE